MIGIWDPLRHCKRGYEGTLGTALTSQKIRRICKMLKVLRSRIERHRNQTNWVSVLFQRTMRIYKWTILAPSHWHLESVIGLFCVFVPMIMRFIFVSVNCLTSLNCFGQIPNTNDSICLKSVDSQLHSNLGCTAQAIAAKGNLSLMPPSRATRHSLARIRHAEHAQIK